MVNSNHLQKKEVEENLSIYKIIQHVPEKDILRKNKKKEWSYGYNPEFDIVVISKDGTIGEIYEIQNLKIALPSTPKNVHQRSKRKRNNTGKNLNTLKNYLKYNLYFNGMKCLLLLRVNG